MTRRLNNHNYASHVTKFQTLGADFEGTGESVSLGVQEPVKGMFSTHVVLFPEAYEVKRKCQQKGKLLHFCPFKTHLPLSSHHNIFEIYSACWRVWVV